MQTIKNLFKEITHKLKCTTPVAIIVGALILGGSHLAYGFIIQNGSPSAVALFKGRAIDDSDFVTGNVKSKVLLVEYSDTECPFCAQLHPTIKKIQDEYASKVAFVYRYFPLTQIHPNAFEESRAIHCVGKVAGALKRQNYIDEMFNYKLSKQNMVLPVGKKESFAVNVGADPTLFTACMQSNESKDVIDASLSDVMAAGVQGTPATFVLLKTRNGYEVISAIDGARPYEYIKAAVDDALAR